jgi:hypothetical protein
MAYRQKAQNGRCKGERRMQKVKKARDVQSASSKNYKTLTLTILGRGGCKSGIKRV